MAEERILITKVSSHCRALRFSCDPFDTEEGMFCAKSVRYVRITEKDCAKCKNPVLMGISSAEAIERMKNAGLKYACRANGRDIPEEVHHHYANMMEAALNALLGVGK